MLGDPGVVFLLDVDNTLLDNDRSGSDLDAARAPLRRSRARACGEGLFPELAPEDLRRAAELFRPISDASAGIDRWVAMDVAPLLADDAPRRVDAASRLYRQAERANCFVKIPGTAEGIPAIEESLFLGGDADAVPTRLAGAGIDVAALAIQLQRDGARAFVKAGRDLLGRIAEKSAELAPA